MNWQRKKEWGASCLQNGSCRTSETECRLRSDLVQFSFGASRSSSVSEVTAIWRRRNRALRTCHANEGRRDAHASLPALNFALLFRLARVSGDRERAE